MKDADKQEITKGQEVQESAQAGANNSEIESADTSQTEEFRAYVPAGAAMASTNEEDYYEEKELGDGCEDELEAEGEDHEEVSPEAGEELDSTADRLREYAEQDFIDETVNTINSMYRHVDNGKLEIGTYILEEVYKGDSDEAMSSNPQKPKTFSKVLQRTDLLVEPKTLGSWVRAAAVRKGFTKKGHVFPNLITYHYVELATVPDYEARVRFARKAELEKLTVKALREVIRKENGKSKSETDQLKADMDASIRRSVDLSSGGDLTDFASDFDSVKKAYPAEKAMKLLPEVKQGLTNVRALEKLLKAFHGSLTDIVNEAMEPLSD